MAIKLFLRSKTGATSTIYFRYTRGRDFKLILKTPYIVNSEKWNEHTELRNTDDIIKNPKDTVEKNHNSDIVNFNSKLGVFKDAMFLYLANNPNATIEEIKEFYNNSFFPKKNEPKTTKTAIPNDFVSFIDHYIKEKSKRIEGKQEPITEATRKKLTTIKNRIILFDKKLLLKNIDDDFRDNLTEYMQSEKFSANTIVKDLKYIKTVCSFASKKKVVINSEVLHWEFITPRQTYTPPILSFQEIEQIKNTIYPHDYLENARDWMIIGFYTGARVSDLLNFTSKNLVDGDILKFRQKKIQNQTHDAEEYIYLHPEVLKVLVKRNGEFPRKISDPRLNEYIKDVCRIAGLTQKMIGGIKDKKQGGRGKKIVKEFEKWELVSSHIFRRSYVTNFLQALGKENMKTQTGHKTDAMVSLYDKTEKIQRALRVKEQMESYLKIV
ncbi:hypothetical protein EG346_09455 [Chryseobacterium carnipullorum]|uniref:Site-specific recombinase XerD n=1 Tax=Chryseobacterium carnipullorum TaxID=1124835 RepID=A0A376DN39_CHRCU|nr:phage integrase SAM-like domain-containing protein [Chryseobacterium carnipullorum]AZA48398.1 hypothetical protein EG346_09455 [Chryseobacterium carnipullorum]AZA63330.1 hypothetical protein EG345_00360 [Chryseobacterium carnipullorum]STC92193.1 Site-specific recombinase XerD [Chryseobacterium carnipullorum]